ncbi:MAG: hypothetical protein Q9225_000354 [Loekoesia sp. 1 TL-2023]
MDLYFLNTAEHFAFVFDRKVPTELLTTAASAYLSIDGDPRLLQLFEAAHSVMLSILAAPQNSDFALSQVGSYTDTLFRAFPQLTSPRQFRFAVKQLVRITSPPSLISRQQPLLSSTLLELLYVRLENASSRPLPRSPTVPGNGNDEPMSEQAVLVLALIDSLPFLPLNDLEDWLPLAAKSIHSIKEPALQHLAKQRFWEVLSNGEMDVERAALCVTWWGTRGGREMLLYGRDDAVPEPLMSGALNESSRL